MRIRLLCGGGEDKEPFDHARPRCRVFRKPPIVLIQPKGSSIRFRLIMLMAYPGWRVVRPSIAERRWVSFCATWWGAAAFAAAGGEVGSVIEFVGRQLPGWALSLIMASPVMRSAVPLASPCRGLCETVARRVRRRTMRVIRALFATEVAFGVRPPSPFPEGGSPPSFGMKLFIEA